MMRHNLKTSTILIQWLRDNPNKVLLLCMRVAGSLLLIKHRPSLSVRVCNACVCVYVCVL